MAQAEFDELVETFAFLDDWEDRYRTVIDMGKALPEFEDAFRVPATKVDGCASQVWLRPMLEGTGPNATFDFEGDSDAMIVKGLIAVLKTRFAGLTAAEAAAVDAPSDLAQLGLDEHLSAQRSNGLRAMVTRLQSVAAQAVAEG
ncbi:MAG: SufE family protein [Pseudomonadota bacterium]